MLANEADEASGGVVRPVQPFADASQCLVEATQIAKFARGYAVQISPRRARRDTKDGI
jgi:hypothetical protein